MHWKVSFIGRLCIMSFIRGVRRHYTTLITHALNVIDNLKPVSPKWSLVLNLCPCGIVGVYGRIPQHLLDLEDECIKQLHLSCSDLGDLKRVSENAQKQYVRSRTQPAPESIKRAKKLPESIPLHPMFETLCSLGEVAQCQLLSNLKHYKPSQV